jgi:muramoyltetrapeptide carboxypeptidase
MLKPPAVAPDARVAVIAPASSSKPERLARGIEALRARGYDAEFGKHAQGRQAPYFSGTAEERLADLHAAFADPEVQAIFVPVAVTDRIIYSKISISN